MKIMAQIMCTHMSNRNTSSEIKLKRWNQNTPGGVNTTDVLGVAVSIYFEFLAK